MSIRVRAYNVGFGDCFLVSFPDAGTTKHMLIDFGNAPGQSNDRFYDIAADIEHETNGHIDVLVISHEHLDHIEGFYSTKTVFGSPDRITVDNLWMSLPSHPDYYTKYPNAQPHKRLVDLAADYHRSLIATGRPVAPGFETMLRNNLNNADRLDFIRTLPVKRTHYLRRGNKIQNSAFKEASATILAPEKDMSVYYEGASHTQLNALEAALHPTVPRSTDWWTFPKATRLGIDHPPNLTPRDWRILREHIEGGAPDTIRAIDKAQNNTSLVFILKADGKRLLFTGDAELESWEILAAKDRNEMKPVDFLKVSHHGSHNGTPPHLVDKLLPPDNAANATVMISTKSKVYGTTNPVPDQDTLTNLTKRCRQLISTDDHPDALYIEITLG